MAPFGTPAWGYYDMFVWAPYRKLPLAHSCIPVWAHFCIPAWPPVWAPACILVWAPVCIPVGQLAWEHSCIPHGQLAWEHCGILAWEPFSQFGEEFVRIFAFQPSWALA